MAQDEPYQAGPTRNYQLGHPNNTIDEQDQDDDTTFTRTEHQDYELKASYARPTEKSAVKENVSIADLLLQIQKLEDTQRHQLFLVLKEMEGSGDMSASNLQRGLQQFLVEKSG